MATFIKWYLGLGLNKEDQKYQKAEYLRYPETYWSTQIKSAEKILKYFKDVNLGIRGEKALEIRLGNNRNTITATPLKGGHMIEPKNIPDTHKISWGEDSLVIEPKGKFKKTFPCVLIIRRIFKPAI